MDAELLPHLGTFAVAAERSSFSAAARELAISQAAVSQRIQQLEVQLRTPLFRREGGRVTLSEAGRRLHEYARRILELTAEAHRAVTGTREEIKGELKLAASSVPGQHLLPHILGAFHVRFPLVKVRVAVSDTEVTLRQIDRGQAHLGIVGGPGGGSNLVFQRLGSDELVLVVPKRHPWWRKKQIAAADLVDQPLIQRELGSASRNCFEQSLERAGLSPSKLNVVLELDSSEAIREAVLEGVGVAVLSRRAVLSDIRAGRLKPVRIDRLALGRDISIVWNRRRVLSGPAQLFQTFLMNRFDFLS